MFHFCPEEAAAIAAALPFTTYLWLWVKAHVFRVKAKPCTDHQHPHHTDVP
jgi:hypothetical protein